MPDVEEVMKNAMAQVMPVIREDLLNNFDNEGINAGQQWAPLAASTVRRRGSRHPILVRSGRLRSKVASIQGDWVDNQIILELHDQIGRYHQAGTRRMPARPPIGLSQEAIENAALAFSEALNAAGFEASVD